MDTRKLIEAAGVALTVFLTGMAAYGDATSIAKVGVINAVYQPVIQGLLAACAALGLRAIPTGK